MIKDYTPKWGNLIEDSKDMKKVNPQIPATMDQYIQKKAKDHINGRDYQLFGAWSVNRTHAVLREIQTNGHGDNTKSAYEFLECLFRSHISNNDIRFMVDRTFRKASTARNGFKWKEIFPNCNLNFDREDALDCFIEWLEAAKAGREYHQKPFQPKAKGKGKKKPKTVQQVKKRIQRELSSLAHEQRVGILQALLYEMNQNDYAQSVAPIPTSLVHGKSIGTPLNAMNMDSHQTQKTFNMRYDNINHAGHQINAPTIMCMDSAVPAMLNIEHKNDGNIVQPNDGTFVSLQYQSDLNLTNDAQSQVPIVFPGGSRPIYSHKSANSHNQSCDNMSVPSLASSLHTSNRNGFTFDSTSININPSATTNTATATSIGNNTTQTGLTGATFEFDSLLVALSSVSFSLFL